MVLMKCPECGNEIEEGLEFCYFCGKAFDEFVVEEDDEARQERIERQRQEFAKSFNEFYEYDVVTIVNENKGRVNKEKMLRILSQKASQGWRLHTIYSNELGKNAISILGLGVNATACEDVLIFERRIQGINE